VGRPYAGVMCCAWSALTERVDGDGRSGARLDRPALDRRRDAMASGGVDVLLVTGPGCLARRYT
jgi:hypothetical protein